MGKGLPRSLARGKGQYTVKKQKFAFKDVAISVAGTSGVGYGSAVIGDLPEGNILFLGAVAYATFTTSDSDVQATYDGDYSVGTTATSDATLSSTDANLIGSTALGAATAGVSPTARGTGVTAAILDNTDGSLEVNLNLIIDDANISGTGDFTASGVVEIAYGVMLDD